MLKKLDKKPLKWYGIEANKKFIILGNGPLTIEMGGVFIDQMRIDLLLHLILMEKNLLIA